MRDIDLLDSLQDMPVITVSDVERIADTSRSYARVILHRLHERGDIHRIERGKYTVHSDPLLIASHIIQPSYISLWTALRYYNLTQQIPAQIQVLHSKSRDSIRFQGQEIVFHQTQYMFGYHKQQHQGFHIFIADRAKLLIDILHLQTVPISELDQLIDQVDHDTAIEYAARTDSPVIAKRLGHLLQPRGENRERLLAMTDSNTALLDTNKPPDGDKDQTWNILDNR